MPILVRLAFRNLLRHPWRTLATILGVATGLAAVLATLSIGDNVRANLSMMLSEAAGSAGLIVAPGVEGRAVFRYDELLEMVEADPSVLSASPVLRHRSEPVRDEQVEGGGLVQLVDSGFQLSGFVMDEGMPLPFELSEGRLPRPFEREIAVSAQFAAQRGYRLSDQITFATQFGPAHLTLTGLLDDSRGYGSTNFGRVGALPLQDLQEMLRLDGRASILEVVLVDGANAQQTMERLQATVGEAFTVTPPEGVGNVSTGLINALQAGLSVLAVTLLALAGFLAYNTFNAAVLERSREYALLRTICLTRAQVQRLALLEAATVSVLGVAFGVLLGIGLAALLTWINASYLGIPMRTLVIPVANVLIAAVLGIAISLLAGTIPAVMASRTPPLTALRTALEVSPGRLSTRLGWLACLLAVGAAAYPWPGFSALAGAAVAMALLFVGLTLVSSRLLGPLVRVSSPVLGRMFGLEGRLGAGMALRNAPRNGVAIGMVVVGMALTVGIGSMVAGINSSVSRWVNTTILGDLFVTTPVTFPDDFEEQVRAGIDGLDVVSGVGFNAVRFQPEQSAQARTVALVLVDRERFHPVTGFGEFQYVQGQGDPEEAYRVLGEDQVLISTVIRERFGLGVGDTMSLRTSEGFRDFTVGGVIVDFTSGGEAVVASIDLMPQFGGGNPDLYVITVLQGTVPQAVSEQLTELFPGLYLDVTLNSDYRTYILDTARRTFATTNLLVALAVFISALGVANTLGMNLSTRQHEIAVLRTLGVTRGGVMRLVTAEGLVVTVAGAVAGILAGLMLSRVITRGAAALSGFELQPAFPWWLIIGGIIASPLIGLVASAMPARRAARLAPVRAMAAEE